MTEDLLVRCTFLDLIPEYLLLSLVGYIRTKLNGGYFLIKSNTNIGLTLSSSIFLFDLPENTRKPKVF